MNVKHERDQDPYRSFLLMDEIAKEEHLSQRALAQRLGISLGLVNSYLKNLVAKGCVRVKAFPKKRYTYLLTPKGLAEKSRLAYQHLSYFTNLYKVARQDYATLFQSLRAEGVQCVVFCGVDEVAEIAYLSLQDAGLTLRKVIDDAGVGNVFFGIVVEPLSLQVQEEGCAVILTSFKRREALLKQLLEMGNDTKNIYPVEG